MSNIELLTQCIESIEDYLYHNGWVQHNEERTWNHKNGLQDLTIIQALSWQLTKDAPKDK